MQPTKEILIEVTEKRYYNKRVLRARVLNFLYCFFIFSYLLFLSRDYSFGLPVALFGFSFALFLREIDIKMWNKYFITKLNINPLYTEVIYKYKNEVRFLEGATSDFDFKLRHTQWDRYPQPYIAISYQGKQLVEQFSIDNWDDHDIKQVVMKICKLKEVEFWKPSVARTFNNLHEKLIRPFFQKFKSD